MHRIHISHVVFQKDSTKKFANPRIGSTAVMDRVLVPFVLEHVPNFVDVAFAEDVVNRLKERPQKKQIQNNDKTETDRERFFLVFAPRIKCELYCNSISMIMMLNQVTFKENRLRVQIYEPAKHILTCFICFINRRSRRTSKLFMFSPLNCTFVGH